MKKQEQIQRMSMLKKIGVLIALTTTFFNVFSQHAVIKGVINQADSTTALPGVSVYLESTSLGAITNGRGNYIIKNIPKGNYTLVVSSIGYLTIKKNINVKPGDTIVSNFIMVESVSTLPEMVVMTKGGLSLKDIPGSVSYISPKEIERFSYTDVNRTLRSIPGVNIREEDGLGLRPNIVNSIIKCNFY